MILPKELLRRHRQVAQRLSLDGQTPEGVLSDLSLWSHLLWVPSVARDDARGAAAEASVIELRAPRHFTVAPAPIVS